MRRIQKQPEPKVFRDWKRGWKPSYADLGGERNKEVRETLHQALRSEQGFLCCYCMCRIPPSNIEHFKPQRPAKTRAAKAIQDGSDLRYDNLLASCESNDPGGVARAPLRCNHKRGNLPLRVSPLQKNCEAHFAFRSNGEIAAARDPALHDAATEAIRILGLDDAVLTRRRKLAIAGLGLDDAEGAFDRKAFQKLKKHYERPNTAGEFEEFAGAIAFVLREWITPRSSTQRR